jgi:4-aminobutyrate aminotransferase-like enzyme
MIIILKEMLKMSKINSLKATIDFERMTNEKMSYLIISDNESDCKFVLTGKEAIETATKINDFLAGIFGDELPEKET